MAWRTLPAQKYRLHDGSLGTEYAACAEVLKVLETRRQQLEDDIEALKRRMQTAEGAPP